jgi:hypothetical protein
MAKKRKQVFEADRKMELRLRLAMKQVADTERDLPVKLDSNLPARDVVDRLIDRVQGL